LAAAGILFVVGEGALLPIREHQNIMVALLGVFVASAVSSVTGFAFSALSGAILFHLLDSPIYAVQVIIVCNIATKLSLVAVHMLALSARIPRGRLSRCARGSSFDVLRPNRQLNFLRHETALYEARRAQHCGQCKKIARRPSIGGRKKRQDDALSP
jgi:hypothetical protein